ncbi:MAG: LPP20 family lipoprotein, partial [Thiohalomonadales bacterium]|nr:LPP20 family lipoprotein [Thiohalomonadales bacterium]
MPFYRQLFLLWFIALFTACTSSGPKQPDWINAASKNYPANAYLLGRGQSDNRALAQDRARADLSKIFQLRVTEESEDVVKFENQSLADESSATTSASASRHITTETDQIVEGIRIAELWQDPANNQFHALAVLDRNQASNDLRQAIQNQDTATEHEITFARQQGNLFRQLAHAGQAVEIQTSRYENQRVLKVIDPTGIGVPPIYNLASLRADRDSLLQRVHIELRLLNDPIGGVEAILQGALAQAGFQHISGNNADYRLEADLLLDGFPDDKGWFWYRGSLQIN